MVIVVCSSLHHDNGNEMIMMMRHTIPIRDMRRDQGMMNINLTLTAALHVSVDFLGCFLVASVPFRLGRSGHGSSQSEASKCLLIFRQMTGSIIMDGFWRFSFSRFIWVKLSAKRGRRRPGYPLSY